MIIDITGTILIPGNLGKDCPGNVENNPQVCCCDECDYFLLCFPEFDPENTDENIAVDNIPKDSPEF